MMSQRRTDGCRRVVVGWHLEPHIPRST
jgi:hypothetical protein